jgi:predicted transcriptional regulator
MDKKIQEMMTLLGCTEAEARQVLTDDKDIDKGQKKDFDLTPEQLKVAKHRGQRAPRVYTHTKRERKENPTKVEIIQALFVFLTEKGYENLNITKDATAKNKAKKIPNKFIQFKTLNILSLLSIILPPLPNIFLSVQFFTLDNKKEERVWRSSYFFIFSILEVLL